MEDYYEYLDSNGVTTLYKLIKDDTVALIDSYSVTINGITTNLDSHVNTTDIHTPIADIENMIDTKVSGLVNSAPETLDTLKELSDALGNDPNFATTVANQIGNKASKDSVYTKQETDTLLEGKANSVHNHVVSDITDFPAIPTKTSELSNDSNFVTSTELHDYATKNDLNSKQDALSEEQLSNIDSIPDKANKSDLSTVATSGSYKDLLDKPVLPEGADLSDYYNKGETDNLLNSKANTSDLAVVAKSGNYNDLNNTPTIPTKLSQLENDMGFGTGGGSGDTSDCVHKTGNETISGIKTFNDILKVAQGTLQVGSDEGYSVTYSWSGNIVSKQPSGTFNISLPNANGTLAIDENLVHKSGTENISGNKVFRDPIFRKFDITTNLADIVYRFEDSNNSPCGYIQNNVHYWQNNLHNRHVAHNNTSGKDIYLDIISRNNGTGTVNIGGDVTSIDNISVVTSDTNSAIVATMGWVNNPATSTNVVHRSGDETIQGVKFFDNLVYLHNNMSNKNSQMDLFTTPANTLYAHYMFVDKNNEVSAYMQYGQQNTGTDFIGLFIHDKNRALHGIQVTTNNYVVPLTNNTYSLGSSSNRWANVHASRINCDNIVRTVEDSYIYMTAGPAWNNGASIFLNGKSGDGLSTGKGTFLLFARDGTNERRLLGYPNGILSWNGCIESHEFRATTGNAFMAQHSGYTFLIRNDGSNTYLLMSDKDGTPGTWSKARPLTINNATGVCSINGHADSANYADVATYATTQATSDNSTKIATTAWVRNYVNSVGGSGNSTLGSSISAYWSTSSVVTNTKQASNERNYPECYSNYIDKTPGVGIIYSGAQLYSELNAHANATRELGGSVQNRTYITKVTAQATFSNPISSTGKYLCTTANTVSFRAYAPEGKSAASVINYSATKSIFIRVE